MGSKWSDYQVITNRQQALAVQTRRFNAGKKGFSKAVRAFVIRSLEEKNGPKGTWGSMEWSSYHTTMSALPHKF
jgi:hypothetical protein